MSSARRTANEVNILAMLDRHEAGGLQKRVLRGLRGRPAAFWYGAAGVLAVGLLSVLAWLARDSGASSAVDIALAGAVSSGGRQASAAVSPLAASAAVAVAVADAASDAASDAVANVAPDAPAQGGATIVDVAPAPAVLREPPRQAAPAHAAAAKAKPRPAASPKPAAATRAPLAHAETRSRRPAAPAKDAPAVDTDVALISAIIQHATKRQEAEEAARKP
jgi:hypothetical protein